ncbi:MAG TPA: iron donor protein CyaY [Rhodocyclaceae bacterium]|nr:MAG: iron donor protein CyaY [Rhodocyclales bacterium CG17_big_fil_post_rev_8_21_14_2_50_68_7]PIX76471.1 MAG: iron donor protein CyaY [Rhodocyclales bacterium CG_4_10_14_3_um_filter_68_10]HCX32594.1 iron donor protein CyaY [Rhodocyclaceae bacterium]
MEEAEFNAVADAALAELEEALAASDLFDYEVKPGGVLELVFDDGSRIVVNRHGAAREIWVAARSGGFHFAPREGRWIDTRSGEELFTALSRLAGEQAGEAVALRRRG